MNGSIVDFEMIREKGLKYGNNFPMIAELWNNYFENVLNVDAFVTESDVANLMGLMKVSRLAHDPSNEDTMSDLLNYMWIGSNYEEYCDLLCDGYEDDCCYDEDDCCYDEDDYNDEECDCDEEGYGNRREFLNILNDNSKNIQTKESQNKSQKSIETKNNCHKERCIDFYESQLWRNMETNNQDDRQDWDYLDDMDDFDSNNFNERLKKHYDMFNKENDNYEEQSNHTNEKGNIDWSDLMSKIRTIMGNFTEDHTDDYSDEE